MSPTLILIVIVLPVVLLAVWLWTVRLRKRLLAEQRQVAAEVAGLTVEEYDAWMKEVDDKMYSFKMKQIHDDQGIQSNGQESG